MLNLGTFLFRFKVLLVTLIHSCVNVLEIMLTFPCPNNVNAKIIESDGCSLTLLWMMWYFLVFIMATVVVCDDSQTFEGEGVSIATRIDFGDSLCCDAVSVNLVYKGITVTAQDMFLPSLGLKCWVALCCHAEIPSSNHHFVIVVGFANVLVEARCILAFTYQMLIFIRPRISGVVLACLKFKTDQAQDAKKMEKLNNIFFALMARGPDVDMSEITGKEQMEAQPSKKGRGRKQ
ncbi:hypothetical protein EZV62_010761 [Acer yangbiense]|uniref:Uncharacterized protein n=1 Tax=Acer yangbiense TaxID=1000413 RepID=A0A5C7I3A2_9ROSI|nr:hypothetical protein EZV62_010761 [Acer yangbiense]